ncbi:MAG: hypothetical protein K2W96_11870 [Gemmataceae bacterium]|nr:hypothetical protein [Gemmataceae bacterium]
MADRVTPTVRLVFACDKADIDPGDQKWVLKHPWSVVVLPPGAAFPFQADNVRVYAQFTGGVGTFELAVELFQVRDDDSRRWVGRSVPATLDFPGGQQLLAFDTAFQIKKARFREPGIYEFRATVDGHQLEGAHFLLRVLDRWA